MTILRSATSSLWVLLYIAFAIVFILKYKGSATGILGALGSGGCALVSLAWMIVPRLMSRVFHYGGISFEVVFGVLNGLHIVAAGLVLVAIALAPGPARQDGMPIAQPWVPPSG